MIVPTSTSRAWQELTALLDVPCPDMKSKHGLDTVPPSSPVERLLAQGSYTLRFKLEVAERAIDVSIANELLPQGRLPKPRRYKIGGDVDHPLISELEISDFFGEVIAWFHEVVKGS